KIAADISSAGGGVLVKLGAEAIKAGVGVTLPSRSGAGKGKGSQGEAAGPDVPQGAKATTSWQGSGPAPGVLGLEPGSVSSKAIQNYFPSTKNGSVEFVFDPKTNTFAVGKPTNNLGGSPHQQLAETIKSDGSTLVGGMFRRGPNGEVITNEFSGHYWKNWTPEVRAKFEQTLKQYDLNVKHHPGM
ncbi:polymorphic toxin type 43 domain-containing protein, partial [Pseudomonas sp.]|uniref:polymorphic toxin type 43 domain-containing protein n=1 Tax=Pseudomonas sp. TaxID=306 RepID=UPI0025866756